jgi:predicted DNA binding protein
MNHIDDFTISRLRQEDLASLMNRNYVPLYGQLTTMEFEILRSAVSNGYYQWPRGYNLDDISRRFNIRKPTVLYHLRNAEKKILGLMFR